MDVRLTNESFPKMKMKKSTISSLLLTIGAASALSGCASVPESMANKRFEDRSKEIEEKMQAQASKPAEALMERVKGNYIGSQPIALPYDATLPPVFRETVLRIPGNVNLATAAMRITAATKLPVRIREDVYYSPKSLAAGQMNQQGGNVAGMPSLPAPLPGDVLGVKALANTDGIAANRVDDFDLSMPTEWTGSLSGYLDHVCNRIGVNWEFRDNTIYIYRIMTKSFQLKVNPGSFDFGSTIAKGAAATAGGTGAGAQSNGSFNSTSTTEYKGKFAVWQTIEAAIRPMLTPIGKVTIDEASGSIIVTDTKEAVSDVGRLIESENAILSRQVEFDVRIIRVALNKSSTADLSVNLAFNKLEGNGAQRYTLGGSPPGSLTSSSSLLPGGLGANIISPGSKFSGTSVFINALNQVGQVISDETMTAITTNRVPVPITQFSNVTYLAQTTPAASGGTGSGPGVPGLTPGQVTTGFFLNALPTVLDNNSVLMRLSLDQSTLTKMGSITTGTGATQQMIQTPNIDGDKSDHSFGLREGESLALLGTTKDVVHYDKANAPTGLSNAGTATKQMQVIIITPRVRPGI